MPRDRNQTHYIHSPLASQEKPLNLVIIWKVPLAPPSWLGLVHLRIVILRDVCTYLPLMDYKFGTMVVMWQVWDCQSELESELPACHLLFRFLRGTYILFLIRERAWLHITLCTGTGKDISHPPQEICSTSTLHYVPQSIHPDRAFKSFRSQWSISQYYSLSLSLVCTSSTTLSIIICI